MGRPPSGGKDIPIIPRLGRHLEKAMKSETVTVAPQPMLFVSRSSSMDQDEIARVMDEGFGAMRAFIEKNAITPLGPPLCIYRTWGKNHLDYEIGFPVPQEALKKASGEVKAGATPTGKAMKFTHRGGYDGLRATYTSISADLNQKGIP